MSNGDASDSEEDQDDPYKDETFVPPPPDPATVIFGDQVDDSKLAVDALEEKIEQQRLRKQQMGHKDMLRATAAGVVYTAPYVNEAMTEAYGKKWWTDEKFVADLQRLKKDLDTKISVPSASPLLTTILKGKRAPSTLSTTQEQIERAKGLYQILARGVKYINDVQRERYRIHFHNRRLRRQRSRTDPIQIPFDTKRVIADAGAGGKWVTEGDKCLWVMLQGSGKDKGVAFYSHAMKRGRFHHSSLNAGNGVAAAGEWETDETGKLVRIYGSSGHYKPEDWRTLWALRELQRAGVLGDAEIRCGTTNEEGKAVSESLKATEVLKRMTEKKLDGISLHG